jgi:hypothetical protein
VCGLRSRPIWPPLLGSRCASRGGARLCGTFGGQRRFRLADVTDSFRQTYRHEWEASTWVETHGIGRHDAMHGSLGQPAMWVAPDGLQQRPTNSTVAAAVGRGWPPLAPAAPDPPDLEQTRCLSATTDRTASEVHTVNGRNDKSTVGGSSHGSFQWLRICRVFRGGSRMVHDFASSRAQQTTSPPPS